jgi:Single-strand binding protein family
MTAHILLSGTLHKAAETRVSKNGRQFTLAKLRVKDGEATQWWQLFVFSESAQLELRRIEENDALAVQGVPKFEIYTPDGGEPRVSLSITVDSVLALRQPPKERKKKEPGPAPAHSEKPVPDRSALNRYGDGGDDPFGDAMPF